MEAYSLDLRQRICVACDQGVETRTEIAERFDVSRWFVHKLLRQRRTQGSIHPKPRGRGPRPRIDTSQQRYLRELLSEKADATLEELCRALRQARSIQVSRPVMCRTLQRLDLRLKKSRWSPRNARRHGCGHCEATG